MSNEKPGISRRTLFDTMAAGSLALAAATTASAAPEPQEYKPEPIANFKYNIESQDWLAGPGRLGERGHRRRVPDLAEHRRRLHAA